MHPEMLADIPDKWKGAMLEFISTSRTTVPGFLEFLDESKAAQSVVDSAFLALVANTAQLRQQQVERLGGAYQAAEALSENTGLPLDASLEICDIFDRVLARKEIEQREINED